MFSLPKTQAVGASGSHGRFSGLGSSESSNVMVRPNVLYLDATNTTPSRCAGLLAERRGI
jgi:hypothetical protein